MIINKQAGIVKSSMQTDLLIIGGGAAGIMAALSARQSYPEYKINIVDRTFALGRKILVCGAGRCNLTNVNLEHEVEKRYYGAKPEFIKAVFSKFGYKEIVAFFNDLGVELYLERKTKIGKLFPVTNQAQTVTALLEDELRRKKIEILLNTECFAVKKLDSGFEVMTRNKEGKQSVINTKKLIIAAGGKTYPALGSDGSGFRLADSLGHTVIEPVPSALPLESKNLLSQLLQGVRMDATVSSFIAGKKIKSATDEIMFTKYGFSGPAILNISREISIRINREHKHDSELEFNFLPELSRAAVTEMLEKRWAKRPDQTVEKSLFGLFPNKFPSAILKLAEIEPNLQVANLVSQQKSKLTDLITSLRIEVQNTRGWNEAEFTAGGVDTSEINAATLESKIMKDLYWCGEVVNVDGDVGGFNLSWAWSSGNLAGKLL